MRAAILARLDAPSLVNRLLIQAGEQVQAAAAHQNESPWALFQHLPPQGSPSALGGPRALPGSLGASQSQALQGSSVGPNPQPPCPPATLKLHGGPEFLVGGLAGGPAGGVVEGSARWLGGPAAGVPAREEARVFLGSSDPKPAGDSTADPTTGPLHTTCSTHPTPPRRAETPRLLPEQWVELGLWCGMRPPLALLESWPGNSPVTWARLLEAVAAGDLLGPSNPGATAAAAAAVCASWAPLPFNSRPGITVPPPFQLAAMPPGIPAAKYRLPATVPGPRFVPNPMLSYSSSIWGAGPGRWVSKGETRAERGAGRGVEREVGSPVGEESLRDRSPEGLPAASASAASMTGSDGSDTAAAPAPAALRNLRPRHAVGATLRRGEK